MGELEVEGQKNNSEEKRKRQLNEGLTQSEHDQWKVLTSASLQ